MYPEPGRTTKSTEYREIRNEAETKRTQGADSLSPDYRALRAGLAPARQDRRAGRVVRGRGARRSAPARGRPRKREKGPPLRAAPCAKKKKRPPRARRPILPRASPAVLSAMRGLTAGFGMVPGDPPLHGRARGGRSPARSKRKWISSVVKAAGPTLGVAWRSRKPDRQIRVRMKMKSSTD